MRLVDKATGRIIWQYQNGVKFRSWIEILPRIGESELQQAFDGVVNLINVDTAEGEQLDIAARIAGIQERPLILPDNVRYFGYVGTPGAEKYGQGPYFDATEPLGLVPVNDSIFRSIVKAKIFFNNSNAVIDDVKLGFEYALGAGYTATVFDLQNMNMNIYITPDPGSILLSLIQDIIVKPQGVGFNVINNPPPANPSMSGELGGDPFGGVLFGGSNP